MSYFKCMLVPLICATALVCQQSLAIEDEDVDEEVESHETDAVNAIADFINNLDEDKAEELRKVISETVDQPVENDAKQYGVMFNALREANSKKFSEIVNILAKESELHEELEVIANNCTSTVTKTVIRSAIKEAKSDEEEH